MSHALPVLAVPQVGAFALASELANGQQAQPPHVKGPPSLGPDSAVGLNLWTEPQGNVNLRVFPPIAAPVQRTALRTWFVLRPWPLTKDAWRDSHLVLKRTPPANRTPMNRPYLPPVTPRFAPPSLADGWRTVTANGLSMVPTWPGPTVGGASLAQLAPPDDCGCEDA